ncbi:hypothetical protein D4764_06G0008240, partial [Takifugu flavidus]
ISNRTDLTLMTPAMEMTTTVTCICSKLCKNQHGLKIHQARMKCLEREVEVQRTGPGPGETQEEPGQEATHRSQSLHVPEPPNPNRVVQQQRIKWPPANGRSEWLQFDEDVSNIIQATAKGDVDSRLQAISTIIVSYGSERFGRIEKGNSETTSYTMNCRSFKIHQLRKELRTLKKQFKRASDGDKQALKELYNILQKKLKTLRRAEWHRRHGRERARKQAAFMANPFRFSKQLLGDKRSGQLECSREEVNRFLFFFFCFPPLLFIYRRLKKSSEVRSVHPSGVPYLVYKRCPEIFQHLWKALKVIWRRGRVADQWRCAEGLWIPKEEDSKNINQFRTISLLSVEGKVFFSIVSRRLTEFLLKNNYIDTSVQKGGIPGVPGCLEHNGVVTQLIREAHESKGELAVLWLDLTNAYGSIPHKLVELALHLHHVPSKIKDLILDYYNNFRLRVTSGSVTSDWHRLEKGIITGCTISVVLFVLAMNMVVKAAEVECRGPLSRSGVRQPPIRAYMDDLTVTTSVPGCRWILQGLERLILWARMSFKPTMSRSMVLKKGKVVDKFRFSISGTIIPSITEQPVKSLGKLFDSSPKDTAAIQKSTEEFGGWLTKVDKSGLPGRFKAWIYQYSILPRVLWPLLVYAVPVTTVESFERKISCFLRRWLGLPYCTWFLLS